MNEQKKMDAKLDSITWEEEEQRELDSREGISSSRKLAGIAAISAGSVLVLAKHGRKATVVARENVLNVDTLALTCIITGVGLVGPSLFPKQQAFLTRSSRTHKSAVSSRDAKTFQFRILNKRWRKEIDRMDREVGVQSFWFPERIRAQFREKRKEERKQAREKLLEKEREIEEQITRDFKAGKSTQEIMQRLTKRAYVIDFNDYDMAIPSSEEIGKSQAWKSRGPESTVDWVGLFRDTVSMLVQAATEYDTVIIRLSSPGGSVSEYGLAASQILRLRRAKLKVVACVDTVCASGGYLMACCADQIIAAPFALLGSIGVVAELPNFHRVLDRFQIDYMLFTAGEFKRTVHHLAENSDEGIAKFQEQLEDIHKAFKDHVKEFRTQVDLDSVATGEAWLASQAKTKGLVDELSTSDEYLDSLENDGFDIIQVSLKKESATTNLVSMLAWDFLGLSTTLIKARQKLVQVSRKSFQASLPFIPSVFQSRL